MISQNFVLAVIGILFTVGMVSGLVLALRACFRFSGKRVITCPETKEPASVHVNLANAAREAVLGKHDLRLDQCSRWPERAGCGQECLSELKADPDKCLVWNLVDDWYKGKACAYCQKPFGEIHWHDRHPALLGPDRSVAQWSEVPPENLPQIFQNYLPVCWNCYIAEAFRRKNPDRVIDRTWRRGPGGEHLVKEPNSEQETKSAN